MNRPPGDGVSPASRYAVGIGARPGVRADTVQSLVERVLAEHGLNPRGAVFATITSRADEPGIREAVRAMAEGGAMTTGAVARGDSAPDGSAWDGSAPDGVIAWHPHELAEEVVANPSGRVAEAVGTPAVAEAAALRTARMLPGAVGAELVVPKTVGDGVTVSVARPVLAGST